MQWRRSQDQTLVWSLLLRSTTSANATAFLSAESYEVMTSPLTHFLCRVGISVQPPSDNGFFAYCPAIQMACSVISLSQAFQWSALALQSVLVYLFQAVLQVFLHCSEAGVSLARNSCQES